MSLEFSILALILTGFVIRRLRIVGSEGEKNITDLVLLVILPCNIFSSFMTKLSGEMLSDCLWVLGISVGIQIVSLIYGRFFFRASPDEKRRNLVYAMIVSNAGFLGNPIAEGIYGAPGLMLASIYLIPMRIMMWSEGLAIYSGNADRRAAVKHVLTHPCVVACFLGGAVMLSGVEVPELILLPIQTLAKCNTAMSMLVIGMILARIDFRHLVDRTVAAFTLHRLVLFPLLVYGVCRLLPVSRIAMGVSVILAAMPAAATTTMLALKYDQAPEFATKLVIFSTLCSIPGIMIWNAILNV